MTWMVVDTTRTDWATSLGAKPFAHFGPFDTEEDARQFIKHLPHAPSYLALPSEECR
jgi:hypothetical protein